MLDRYAVVELLNSLDLNSKKKNNFVLKKIIGGFV
jgi:hypothetical protein